MLFYCHFCHRRIEAESLPDYKCPNCQSGFIESITAPAVEDNPDDNSDVEILEPLAPLARIVNLIQASDLSGRRQTPQTVSANSNESQTSQAAQLPANRTSRVGSRIQTRGNTSTNQDSGSPSYQIEMLFEDFFGHPPGQFNNQGQSSSSNQTPASRGLIDFPVPFFLHSNPADYAWGNAGFDAVITQLLNNLDGSSSGPTPMSKNQIDELPKIIISEEQVKRNMQCSICINDYNVGDSARQLPCEHIFHNDCIIPWLNLVSRIDIFI